LYGDVTQRFFGGEVEILVVSKTPGIAPGEVMNVGPASRGFFDLACHKLARDVIWVCTFVEDAVGDEEVPGSYGLGHGTRGGSDGLMWMIGHVPRTVGGVIDSVCGIDGCGRRDTPYFGGIVIKLNAIVSGR